MSTVTLIYGDGVGSEIMLATKKVVDATKVNIEWEERVAGNCCMSEYGTDLPIETIASVYQSNLVLKGPTMISESGADADGNEIAVTADVTPALISAFGLFTNYTTAKTLPNLKSTGENIDVVVFREMTEDLYKGLERQVDSDTVQAIKQFTKTGCQRFIKSAFEYAVKNNRKKITIVHQADKLKLTDGLFLETAKTINLEYPDINLEDKFFDVICTELISEAENFDMIVCPNMYGAVISKMVSHISGTSNITPTGTMGNGTLGIQCAVFEPSQDAMPEIAGENVANPIGAILAGAMMLSYMGEQDACNSIEKAVSNLLNSGEVLPKDLGGSATTEEVTNAIISQI